MSIDGKPVGQVRRHLHVLRGHGRRRGVVREGRQGPPARQGVPGRLRRRHRLGLGRELGRGPTRPDGHRHGHRRHRHQRRAGRVARRRHPRHRRRPGRVQAGDRPVARRHPRLRHDGRGGRVRPVRHQRAGRRLGRSSPSACSRPSTSPRRSRPSARRARSWSPASARSPKRCGCRAVRADAVPEAGPGRRCSARRAPAGTSRGCCSCTRAASSRLDELITRRYKLDDINQGYADMHAGKNIRGVIVY